MKFLDKLTADGRPEQFETGEVTERFIVVAETRKEAEGVRAALANVAIIALQSEVALDPEDARILIDFLRADPYEQARLTVYAEQAQRLAGLIQRGASTAMPEILQNQFYPQHNRGVVHTDDEELTRTATDIAHTLSIEADARKFRSELDDTSLGDFFEL